MTRTSYKDKAQELEEKLAAAEAVIAKQTEEIAILGSAQKEVKAVNTPFLARNTQDTNEMELTEENERKLSSVGNAKDALDLRELEVVDKPPSQKKMEELAFMEEYVTVKVHDTTDENAVPVPPVWNDGRAQYFIRGEEQVVKRKYVERLARAKHTTFTQRKELDGMGNETYVQVPHTALLYPFEVIEDKNPRGRDWLRGIIREPQ